MSTIIITDFNTEVRTQDVIITCNKSPLPTGPVPRVELILACPDQVITNQLETLLRLCTGILVKIGD